MVIFQNRPMISHIDMESSCRDLLNDMAEQRSVLKNNQNTHYSHIFFRIELCLATIIIESFSRGLSNDTGKKKVLLYQQSHLLKYG